MLFLFHIKFTPFWNSRLEKTVWINQSFDSNLFIFRQICDFEPLFAAFALARPAESVEVQGVVK